MPRSRTQPAEALPEPRIDDVNPAAALPLGEVELTGNHLGPNTFGPPAVLVDGTSAQVVMSRPGRLIFRVPELASTGMIEVRTPARRQQHRASARSPRTHRRTCIPSPARPSAARA